jgi:replication factor C subunit 1
MDWGLLPNYGICSSIAPALILKGKSFYPRFPEWLGKNSSQRKTHRQIKELKFAMGSSVHCNKQAIQQEVVPIILQELYNFISKDNAKEAIDLLDKLHITNDMLKEHLMDLCIDKRMEGLFDKLSTAQKSAFTRNYN